MPFLIPKIQSYISLSITKPQECGVEIRKKLVGMGKFNTIQYGLFLKLYGMGGGRGIMAPLVTLLFLKVEGQNLAALVFWCAFFKNGINF